MTIPKKLLESKLITDEQWKEYQSYKQSKQMILNKICIVKDKIKNKYYIEEVIKDINNILEYFKEDEVWQEYSKMYLLFMDTYNTCLVADKKGE
jgi:hypothetical protein